MRELMAHRGYAAQYPENTLSGLVAAIDAGVTRVEFDIQLSADRVPVLMHDDTLERTCGVPGAVWDRSHHELATLRAGESHRFGDRFEHEPLPSLAETVAVLDATPQVTAFVELKAESIQYFGVDVMLDAVLPIVEPLLGRAVIISFDDEIVRLARSRARFPIGWCVASYGVVSHDIARDLAPEYLLTNYLDLPSTAPPLWDGNWQWVLYEVVDPDIADGLLARGAHIIETMDIGAFA